jgi:CRP/FNR family cyclic AMP-dependent transcriptional regulator
MYRIVAEEVYNDGDFIFEEGNSGDWIYVILSGAVELSKKVGDEQVVIKVLQPDEVFGEIGFIARIPRTATAKAVGTTTVGIIDRKYLDEEFNKLSGGFRTILRSLTLRLTEATDKAVKSVLER